MRVPPQARTLAPNTLSANVPQSRCRAGDFGSPTLVQCPKNTLTWYALWHVGKEQTFGDARSAARHVGDLGASEDEPAADRAPGTHLPAGRLRENGPLSPSATCLPTGRRPTVLTAERAENAEHTRQTEEPTTTGTKDTKNNKHEL